MTGWAGFWRVFRKSFLKSSLVSGREMGVVAAHLVSNALRQTVDPTREPLNKRASTFPWTSTAREDRFLDL